MGQLDKYFGGERGAAQRALAAMKKTYGARDGQAVFDARIAKLKRRGKVRGRRR